ncbi:uncharacterized protein N7458_012063 [Penicillium daleae]|uniref:Uncharacterized protein n=1 Tax=Penicillium daleae TaxID=63821 RepID=A0AAD6BTU1_9EURO|nr:uncharacterized protein N7458_012063 [Penicillium daleae]KAJ5432907.1 hypothetical protein N7458_012063 [Penicillium daleae]
MSGAIPKSHHLYNHSISVGIFALPIEIRYDIFKRVLAVLDPLCFPGSRQSSGVVLANKHRA